SASALRAHPPPPLFPYTTLFRSSLRAKYRNPSWKSASLVFVESIWTAFMSCGTAFEESFAATYIVPRRRCSSAVMSVSAHCAYRSEEHTSELQSRVDLVCRLLLD